MAMKKSRAKPSDLLRDLHGWDETYAVLVYGRRCEDQKRTTANVTKAAALVSTLTAARGEPGVGRSICCVWESDFHNSLDDGWSTRGVVGVLVNSASARQGMPDKVEATATDDAIETLDSVTEAEWNAMEKL